MLTKKCSVCSEVKPLGDFHKNKNKKDGRTSTCKNCAKARARQWNIDNNERARAAKRASYAEYIRANPQEAKEKRRHYYEKNKNVITKKNKQYVARNQEVVTQRKRRWFEKNRERLLRESRERYEKNKADLSEGSRAWREKNREKVRAYQRKYNALKRGASIGEVVERDVVFKQADGKCHYCGDYLSKGWHIDHIVPLSRGGLHTYENVVASCARCNLSKSSRTPKEWKEWLPGRVMLGECNEKEATHLTLPPRKELIYYYQECRLSLAMVAKEYQVSQTTVYNWMVKYDIPRRKAWEK